MWSLLLNYTELQNAEKGLWILATLFTGIISLAGFKTWEEWS